MWRTIAYVVGGLVFLAALGWWFFIREPSTPKNKEQPVAASTQTLPKKGPGPVVPVAAPAADASTAMASPSSGPKSPYKGFWYEDKLTPERLASIIDGALARDSSGTKLIDEAKCARDGSCAAPINYLEAIQVYDPEAGLTHVSQLPGYFRTKLVMDCDFKGHFEMADIFKPTPGPARGRTETHRMSRDIGATECVFKNKVTGRPIIAQKCANPVGKKKPRPAPPPPPEKRCVEVPFNHKYVGGEVIWSIGSTSGPLADDVCNRVRQGNGGWKIWGKECARCVPPLEYLERIFRRAAAYFHPHTYTTTEVKQTLRFSEEVWGKALNICLKDPEGNQTYVVHVRPEDWKGRHVVPIPDRLWKLYVPPE